MLLSVVNKNGLTKYTKEHRTLQFRLCWWAKKNIPGPMNLHELTGISGQTGNCQISQKRGTNGEKPLFPVFPELTDDIFDVAFINQEIL